MRSSDMQDFKRLRVWQDGRALTVAIHDATRSIRPGVAPDLRSQLLRASMSILANVAEGAARDTRADFARVVSMAIASASEVEHHLQVCNDLGLVERGVIELLLERVMQLRRMLIGLKRTLLLKEAQRHDGSKRSGSPERRKPSAG